MRAKQRNAQCQTTPEEDASFRIVELCILGAVDGGMVTFIDVCVGLIVGMTVGISSGLSFTEGSVVGMKDSSGLGDDDGMIVVVGEEELSAMFGSNVEFVGGVTGFVVTGEIIGEIVVGAIAGNGVGTAMGSGVGGASGEGVGNGRKTGDGKGTTIPVASGESVVGCNEGTGIVGNDVGFTDGFDEGIIVGRFVGSNVLGGDEGATIGVFVDLPFENPEQTSVNPFDV